MRKKAFTLIEMIGIIIVLGVITLIAVPMVNGLIKSSKESALKETINIIETAAYNYSNANNIGYNSKTEILEISELKNKGYLKNESIINPVTDEELEGCVLYRWDDNNKQYQFAYTDSCELVDLTVNITNLTGEFNELNWAKEDFYVSIDTNGTSYNYCISNKKCSPNSTVNSSKGTAYVTLEDDELYVCAYAIYGQMTSEIVCNDEIYKLDKTLPESGTVEFVGTQGDNDWYISDVEVVIKDGADSLSGHNNTMVNKALFTENTKEEKVVVTTTDNAGNISTREYTVKIDKDDPIVNIARKVESNRNKLVTTTNNVVSGFSYEWYKNDLIIPGQTGSELVSVGVGTYKVKVKTGSGKTAYSNEVEIKGYDITYDLNGGTGNVLSQVKEEDIDIVLSNVIPTKNGYEFIGWGITNNQTSKTYASGATYKENADLKLYALWKKVVTITYNANGASLKSINDKIKCEGTVCTTSCIMYNNEPSCNVLAPKIERVNFDILGFNIDKDAKVKQVNSNSNVDVSNNTTYYAITKKDIDVKFNKNGAYSLTIASGVKYTDVTLSCTIWNRNTTCGITSPTIVGSTNTPEIVGWALTVNSKISDWQHNTSKQFSENIEYYAITKKSAVTLTANFNANSATLVKTDNTDSNIKDTCILPEVYNGVKQATECTVYSPEIKGSTNTPTVVGFNTNKNATTSQWTHKTSKVISSDVTYYAITKKEQITLTATFDANGATLVKTNNTDSNIKDTCILAEVYNGVKQATECTVYSPEIKGSTNTPTVVGFNTNKNATTSQWTHKTSKVISSDVTYYAITKKGSVTLTATFDANGASLSTTSVSCELPESYNGASQAKECQISVPKITRSGYTIVGFGTFAEDKTADIEKDSTVLISSDSTYYAITKIAVKLAYDANGGSGIEPDYSVCTMYNKDTSCSITIGQNVFDKGDYSFIGWGLNSSDKTSKYTPGKSYSFSESDRLYALWRKELTATFNGNGATLSGDLSPDCYIYNAETECEVTAPTITRSNYNIVGFHTNNNHQTTTPIVVSGGKVEISSNTDFYAITYKTLTAYFNKNGAYSLTPYGRSETTTSVVEEQCNIWNTITSCSVTSPKIKGSSNTPRVLGFHTSSNATSSLWNENTSKNISSDVTYYAITYSDSYIATAIFKPNNATLVDTSYTDAATYDSCTVSSSYNGAAQQGCTVYSPKITAPSNTPEVIGFNTSSNGTSSSWNVNASKTISSDVTYYAITKKSAVTRTVTFYKNGAEKLKPYGGSETTSNSITQTCEIAAVYNGASQDTSCSIISPSIIASSVTPTVIGWGTSSSSTSSSWSTNTSNSFSSDASYYAVTKRNSVTLTATFVANNATLKSTSYTDSATKDSCTISEAYNGEVQGSTCTVYSPEIQAPYNTPNVVGFNTSSNGTSNEWSHKSSKEISDNVTYYAITKSNSKEYTATFVANNATLKDTSYTDSATKDSCTISATYNGAAQGSSCTVYSPEIQAPTNTPSVVGFNTSSNGTSNEWSHKSSKSISGDVTYYAITKKEAEVVTVTYNANGGTGSVSNSTCTREATYNGKSQSFCTLNLRNNGFARSGYKFIGWKKGSDIYAEGDLLGFYSDATLYAEWEVSYICSVGTLKNDSNLGYICVDDEKDKLYTQKYYTREENKFTCSTVEDVTSCLSSGSSSELSYVTCSDAGYSEWGVSSSDSGLTNCLGESSTSTCSGTSCSVCESNFGKWELSGTANKNSCSGYQTSLDGCNGTLCSICTTSTTPASTIYTVKNYTRSYSTAGGRWCTAYDYEPISGTADYSSVDQAEEACRGNTECKYTSCEPTTLKYYTYYPKWEDCDEVCDGTCSWANDSGHICSTDEVVEKTMFRCELNRVKGCNENSWGSVCKPMSDFDLSVHKEGLDYKDCSGNFYGNWTEASTTTGASSCSGVTSLDNCTGTSCTVCSSSTKPSSTTYTAETYQRTETYTKTIYSRNQLYDKQSCSRSSVYGSWTLEDTTTGLTSCTDTDASTATTWDYDCEVYYACPSGWSSYGDTECYKAAESN